jgi:hypothetical protein
MKWQIVFRLISLLLFFLAEKATGCSMYKVTAHGKTLMGSNYDAWYLNPRIWFENARKPGETGVAFTGARDDGANGVAPQSALNEAGLSFSGAAIPPLPKSMADSCKVPITNRTQYLKDIMHTCKTVEEVKAYIEKYDYGNLTDDIFFYADASGKYLVVEPGIMTLGTDHSYAASNFCPSFTPKDQALKMSKYRNGLVFLEKTPDSSLAFCSALSDTMSVSRPGMGDGTLLTIIRDLNDGIIHLYFYHDYAHKVSFHLKTELAKGDHVLSVASMFPPNANFEKLRGFHTPQHSPRLVVLMLVMVSFLALSGFLFLIWFAIGWKQDQHRFLPLFLFVLSEMVAFYMLILTRKEPVFFFPAPYHDPSSDVLSAASYIPFLVVLSLIPLLWLNRKLFRLRWWPGFFRWLLVCENAVLLVCAGLFAYWGFYSVWG